MKINCTVELLASLCWRAVLEMKTLRPVILSLCSAFQAGVRERERQTKLAKIKPIQSEKREQHSVSDSLFQYDA